MNRTKPLLSLMLKHEVVPSSGSKVVVFLHGLLGSGKNLKTFAKRLSDRHEHIKPLLLDLRGHGSSPPGSNTTLNKCAQDVIFTLKHLGFVGDNSPIGVVGHR